VSAYHQPVLVQEVCAAVLPALSAAADPVFVDCTAGGGGHLAAVHERLGGKIRCLALDRDPAALAEAALRVPSCRFVHAGFAELAAVLRATELPAPAAILADLGVSSHQLDTADRGFSFQADAPLDMRMDPSRGPTLAEAPDRPSTSAS
jgi:16S rRNA (cytosine1402-N4)-methyltransferase